MPLANVSLGKEQNWGVSGILLLEATPECETVDSQNPPLASFLQTIESNWRCGRHNLQRIQCRSENSKGVYCLQYDDDKIISGLRDNSIKASY